MTGYEASWEHFVNNKFSIEYGLTVGGANDLGSIMIEENVVSAAGVSRQIDAQRMQESICAAGFQPKRRNQQYQYIAD